MRQFYLADIVTKDKLSLQGLYAEPNKKGNPTSPNLPAGKAGLRGARRAILWMHGLSSAFYHEPKLLEMMADAANKEGWGFAQFNGRGHDILAGVRKLDGTVPYGYSYYPAGAGAEVFEESVMDIEAGIDFLVARGFTEIIIVGHSTGANKVCYYAATQKNPHVFGVVLSGPMSDRLDMARNDESLQETVKQMHKLVSEGKGDELLVGYHFFPLTPKRYISLFEPRSSEDVFDYGEAEPKLSTFSKIQLPLMVLLSGADEATDRPIEEVQKAFDTHANSPKYQSVIIPGALHRFNGHEKQAVSAIIDWIKSL